MAGFLEIGKLLIKALPFAADVGKSGIEHLSKKKELQIQELQRKIRELEDERVRRGTLLILFQFLLAISMILNIIFIYMIFFK